MEKDIEHPLSFWKKLGGREVKLMLPATKILSG